MPLDLILFLSPIYHAENVFYFLKTPLSQQKNIQTVFVFDFISGVGSPVEANMDIYQARD